MTEQMDIGNVIRQVLKQWMLIVMLGVIAALGSGIVASRMYRPQYETQAIIVVYAKDTYENGVTKARETAEVFEEIITSSVLQKKVAEAMEMDNLPGTITCEGIPATNMITLKVCASTPRNAMLVMNGILDHYEEVASQLLVNIVLQVLEEPEVPVQAKEVFQEKTLLAKTWLFTVAGVSAILLLYYYFRDDIKNEGQVEKKLDTNLFATIYHENMNKGFHIRSKRKKVGVLVTNPVTSFGYVETFQKLSSKLDYKCRHRNIRTILVTSVQENEGKSTVSANLALSLAKRGKKVLLVDADIRKPAQFKLFDQTYDKKDCQIGDVFAGKAQIEEAVHFLEQENLFLLGGNRSYRNATKLLISKIAGNVFAQLGQEMDYVILDTPPLYLAADTEELLPYADAALLVVRQNGAKVKDINDAIDIFKKTDCRLLGCVLNNVENGAIGSVHSYGDGYSHKYGYGYGYGNYKKQKEPKEKA